MLKLRVLTAFIGLPIIIGLFAFGPMIIAFALLLGCALICVHETHDLISPRLAKALVGEQGWGASRDVVGEFLALGTAVAVMVAAAFAPERSWEYSIVFGVIIQIGVGVFSRQSPEEALARVLSALMSFAYGCLPWLAIYDLYILGADARYLFFLLAIVWCGDTGAYFGGKVWGKTQLAPIRSPKKTWEGALSGLSASMLGGVVTYFVFNDHFAGIFVVCLASALGGIAGQLGDLIESTLKRFAQVKDSSSLLPGHGGFLDRVDGILFAAPFVWYVLYLTGVSPH